MVLVLGVSLKAKEYKHSLMGTLPLRMLRGRQVFLKYSMSGQWTCCMYLLKRGSLQKNDLGEIHGRTSYIFHLLPSFSVHVEIIS